MNKKSIYKRIIGFILCLPFIYFLYACGLSQPSSLILLCALGAGSGLTPFTDISLVIGLYLMITGGGKRYEKYIFLGCILMNLKEFLKPDKEKIIISGTILILSIICILIGIYFGGSNSILRLFFIAASFFYLPVLLLPEIVDSIIPSMRPDMDTMTAFYFQSGLMFVFGCVYAYLVSCAIIFVRRKRKRDNDS